MGIMNTHTILLHTASKNDATYGIAFTSDYVFRTAKSSAPTRVQVWANIGRLNPRDGEPVRYSSYGKIDGGKGRYLDPHRNATDSAITVLLTPESSVIDGYGTNTGTEASGQVYAQQDSVIREGDTLRLVYPGGRAVEMAVHFTNNGHGEAN